MASFNKVKALNIDFNLLQDFKINSYYMNVLRIIFLMVNFNCDALPVKLPQMPNVKRHELYPQQDFDSQHLFSYAAMAFVR